MNKTPTDTCGCCAFKGCCGKSPCPSHAAKKSNINDLISKHKGVNLKCDNAKCRADQKLKETLKKHKLQDALAKKKECEKKAKSSASSKASKIISANDATATATATKLKGLEAKVTALASKKS